MSVDLALRQGWLRELVWVFPQSDGGQELKLVFPQPLAMPERFADLPFERFFLQPMDGPERERNTRLAVEYCLAHPQWRLGLQTHKVVGIA